jgi:DNA modification methylase
MLTPYYEDDYVLLYHGDNLEILPDICEVDCVLTDPPYGISKSNYSVAMKNKDGSVRGVSYDFGEWDYAFDSRKSMNAYLPLIRDGGNVIIFHANEQTNEVLDVFEQNGITWKRALIMQKNTPLPAAIHRNYVSDIEHAQWGVKGNNWTFNKQNANGYDRCVLNGMVDTNIDHPTPKPLKVIEELVLRHTNAGDLVLDPFGGSGTIALACKRNGRFCIMIEQDKKYCDLIVSRLKQDVLPLFIDDGRTVRDVVSERGVA